LMRINFLVFISPLSVLCYWWKGLIFLVSFLLGNLWCLL
jgi:hypothetical protein